MVTFSFSIFKTKAKIDERINGLETKVDRLERSINNLTSFINSRYESMDLKDDKFEKALEIIKEYDLITASMLQRRLSIGYSRAASLLDKMYEDGYLKQDNVKFGWKVVKRHIKTKT